MIDVNNPVPLKFNDGYIYWGGDGGERVFGVTSSDAISEILSGYYSGQAVTGGSGGTKLYKNGFDVLKSLDSNHTDVFNASDAA